MKVVVATLSKATLRSKCRIRWGADWHKVHPLIKKARLMWAAGTGDGTVVVYEQGVYTV